MNENKKNPGVKKESWIEKAYRLSTARAKLREKMEQEEQIYSDNFKKTIEEQIAEGQ